MKCHFANTAGAFCRKTDICGKVPASHFPQSCIFCIFTVPSYPVFIRNCGKFLLPHYRPQFVIKVGTERKTLVLPVYTEPLNSMPLLSVWCPNLHMHSSDSMELELETNDWDMYPWIPKILIPPSLPLHTWNPNKNLYRNLLMMAFCRLNLHIFTCLPIETQAFPLARVGKLWPVGQIWCTTCFSAAYVSRMAFADGYL